MDISNVGSLFEANALDAVTKKAGSTTLDFEGMLGDAIQNLSETEQYSDDLLMKLAAGEDVDLHEVMLAAEQTNLSFQIAMNMRDKLLDAYNTLTRMQI